MGRMKSQGKLQHPFFSLGALISRVKMVVRRTKCCQKLSAVNVTSTNYQHPNPHHHGLMMFHWATMSLYIGTALMSGTQVWCKNRTARITWSRLMMEMSCGTTSRRREF